MTMVISHLRKHTIMKFVVSFITGITVIVAVFFLTVSHAANAAQVRVERVLDGDTVVLSTGEQVHLLGVNAPEEGECFAQSSKKKLAHLVARKQVKMVLRTKGMQTDGVMYAHFYTKKKSVNKRLIVSGRARFLDAHLSKKMQKTLSRAELRAQEKSRGLWSRCATQDNSTDAEEQTTQSLLVALNYSNFSLDRGDKAKAQLTTEPGAYCTLDVMDGDDAVDQVAGSDGLVFWEWVADMPVGIWPVTVTCSKNGLVGTVSGQITVGNPM